MIPMLKLFSAFTAGLLTFLSPCILPLIPGYLSFMTGISLDNLKKNRSAAIFSSIVFSAGFSLIFIILGASATALGKIMLNNLSILSKLGAIIIIIFGLQLTGILKIKALNIERRVHLQNSGNRLWSSFFIGIFFGLGWSPCIGPILGSILVLASEQQTIMSGIVLLTAYSLGISVPFILTALALDKFFMFFNKIKKYFHLIEILAGTLLILMGILMFFGQLEKISLFLLK